MLSAIQVVMSSITTLLPLGFDCTIADRYQNDTAHLRECGLGYVPSTRIFSAFSRWRLPWAPAEIFPEGGKITDTLKKSTRFRRAVQKIDLFSARRRRKRKFLRFFATF